MLRLSHEASQTCFSPCRNSDLQILSWEQSLLPRLVLTSQIAKESPAWECSLCCAHPGECCCTHFFQDWFSLFTQSSFPACSPSYVPLKLRYFSATLKFKHLLKSLRINVFQAINSERAKPLSQAKFLCQLVHWSKTKNMDFMSYLQHVLLNSCCLCRALAV